MDTLSPFFRSLDSQIAILEKRIELHQFLEKLHRRYGLVFGDKDAERVLAKQIRHSQSDGVPSQFTATICSSEFFKAA